jgi:hypothetical protein
MGIDGNLTSFVAGYALIASTTTEVFQFVFACCKRFFGTDACAAVHWILGDEDGGQNAALRASQVQARLL